ncbi:hypothetical protein BRC96_07395 [Halobacteriales archaeon QS_6_64_34]|nr:MAG: hypothetical protein BRC96_07395 [Halobacteriales archaeon QS_6_64_34]
MSAVVGRTEVLDARRFAIQVALVVAKRRDPGRCGLGRGGPVEVAKPRRDIVGEPKLFERQFEAESARVNVGSCHRSLTLLPEVIIL